MGLKVCKFGGTSLADAEQIRKVCDIVLADPDRRIVALSAPGKRNKEDRKVTDLLIDCAEAQLRQGQAEAQIARVVERFAEIARGLGVDPKAAERVRGSLEARLSGPTADPASFTDGVKALGEEHCARIVAEYLVGQGHAARYVDPGESGMLLSDEAGKARVLPVSYKRLAKLRDYAEIVIFPGFFGYTPAGALVTFPRGGTDITGAVLAAAVSADLYENFTDVDYVLSAQPDMVDNPLPIEVITYAEMRELSYAGFSVFHDEALEPVFHAGIPVRIANTNNPASPGTRLEPRRSDKQRQVVGVAASRGFATIFIEKYLMNREMGFGRRLLQIIEEAGLSFEHCPSGIDSISVIVRDRQLTADVEKMVLSRIDKELNPDRVAVERGLALVMVVGEGMRYTVGLAARATNALAGAKVNIEMMNQGASEISMMFGVKDENAKRAVQALYDEFFRTE